MMLAVLSGLGNKFITTIFYYKLGARSMEYLDIYKAEVVKLNKTNGCMMGNVVFLELTPILGTKDQDISGTVGLIFFLLIYLM